MLWLGHCHVRLGDDAAARTVFQSVLVLAGVSEEDRQDAERAMAWCDGRLAYRDGRYADAVDAFTRLVEQPVEEPEDRGSALLWLGQCHVRLGDDIEARTVFQSVLALAGVSEEDRQDAERAMAWCVGRLAYRDGRCADAVDAFTRLVEQPVGEHRDRCNALLWLGHCHYSLGRYEAARESYVQVLDAPGATKELRESAAEWAEWCSGRLHYACEEYGEAARRFSRLVEGYGDDHAERCTALLWLAACYFSLGAHAAARGCYGAVLESPQATADEKSRARTGLARLS